MFLQILLWLEFLQKLLEISIKYDFLKKGDELSEAIILKLTPEQQEIAKMLVRRLEFRVLSNDDHE